MDLHRLKAKDIMQSQVIKVSSGTTVFELEQLFQAKRITGAPVVDAEGRLIGVVSETDIVRLGMNSAMLQETTHPFFRAFAEEEDVSEESAEFSDLEKHYQHSVEEIMTPFTLTASEDALVTEIAKLMSKNRVHRILIVDENNELKGIVTTLDIVRAVAGAEK